MLGKFLNVRKIGFQGVGQIYLALVTGFFEDGNEHSGQVKGRECLDQPSVLLASPVTVLWTPLTWKQTQ
jgi:hypothetical protein